jgi:hypothetical protein
MQPIELWRKGYPLSEAWFRFASPELRRDYDGTRFLKMKPGSKTGIGMLLAALPKGDKRRGMARRTWNISERYQVRSELRHDMRERLLRRLRSGKLLAYGYPANADLDADPVRIPERLLESKFVLWTSDTISAPPHKYLAVRVVRPSAVSPSARRPTVPLPPPPRRGRPAVVGLVRQIYREASRKGLFAGKSEKEIVAIVQELSRERFPKAFPKSTQPSPSTVRSARQFVERE